MKKNKVPSLIVFIAISLALVSLSGLVLAYRTTSKDEMQGEKTSEVATPEDAPAPPAAPPAPQPDQEQPEVAVVKPTAAIPDNCLPLQTILNQRGLTVSGHKLVIYVKKSAKVLSLYLDGELLKSYHVELGDSGLADKQVSGDHRTPEGTFYITEKSKLIPSDEFLGSRWFRLSYPNVEDAERGLRQGLIDQATRDAIVEANANYTTPPQRTALGGGVGIHGGSRSSLGPNWTWGCVGLSDRDVEEFFDYIAVGTTVVIEP
ncbi:L,D-transpeptidase-like protein [Hydrogenispora ethanolica]|uniref:L,D-transpeptidase-like protein n=1 Tax=Hydrogenispora ethanolica TaxID=1082276 RepID=A0A4R1RG89_HYDET|nr:L,D-transpeptidase [Hydrogenispora ethanolica]TCL64710.1 L,D-transpeptidase-like protein [Hydrogenispora ethanolica]